MTIHYVNFNKKRLVGRNNQPNVNPLVLDYSTVETISFQFIADNNQIVDISGLSGLYFAGSLSIGQMSYDLLFLSKDYTIENNILSFVLDTYTVNWLNKIRKKNTIINIEIGQVALEEKRVMMRETALANPRVYVAGLSPAEIDSHDYYTKEEVDELIEGATSGAVSKEYVDEADELLQGEIDGLVVSKQDLIDSENKLSYALLSGTPDIPTKTSDLTNDSDYQTGDDVDATLEAYQTKITEDAKLDYGLLSATPTIPTKTSDLTNDSGFITNEALSTKQDIIDSNNKLAYSLISGTPTIPEKTSDLTNDSDYQTGSQVQAAVSGKADKSELEDYQLKITNNAKLDYALISGAPAEYNPVDVSLEMKTATTAGTFTGSFEGKQIQKWVYTDATSGTITIAFDAFSSTASDIAPTIEMHIGLNGNVSTITLPASLNIVDIPDSLTYNGQTSSDIDYHVFVLRAEKDMNGTWQYYINYAYDYIETIA